MKENRFFSFDLLRVIACYMVIQVHAGEFFYIGEDGMFIPGNDAFWVNIYNSVCRTAVPLFVMITGFFLLPVKIGTGEFFKKRFSRVLYPFVIWCILYAFYQFFQGDTDLQGAFINILKIPVNYGVEVGHLWYIYMLLGLYMVFPVVSPWLEKVSKKWLQIYLGIWAFTLLLPFIHQIFPEVLGECFWNPTPMLYYFSGFLGYTLLAFYIRKYWMERKSWNIPVGIALLVVGYFITYWGFATRGQLGVTVPYAELTWGYDTINVGLMSLGIFLLLKNVNAPKLSGLNYFIGDVSKLSYGMYLGHIMVLNFCYQYLDGLFDSAAIKIPVLAISCFLGSYLLMKILSYLPKSKYIVG